MKVMTETLRWVREKCGTYNLKSKGVAGRLGFVLHEPWNGGWIWLANDQIGYVGSLKLAKTAVERVVSL